MPLFVFSGVNMYTQEQLEEFRRIINSSRRAVFFGGAGVSTESGIPDFRSQDGLYNIRYAYPPEYILSATFFRSHTEEFFSFYREKMVFPKAKPNAAHIRLAGWEREGRLAAVVTQNIDGLHQRAGSRRVFELHGSVLRNFCMACGKSYPVSFVAEAEGIPRCSCGGIVKPDVVLYEEPLDGATLEGAVRAIRAADVLIVGGTSLNVYPAAGLIDYFEGDSLIVVNRGAPARAVPGCLLIDGKIGEVFSAL